MFTNVRFLQELKQETSNRSRLKNLLILLSRLLALAALIFAFAQPIITDKKDISMLPKLVSIFIDNSFSMQALSSDVPLFDLARDKAREIVNAFGQNDKFQIITHDFEARHQRSYSQENALSLIDEIQISPQVDKLSVALSRQQQILDSEAAEKDIYIISDFQKNITDLEFQADSVISYNLIPLQSVQEKNVSIDSVWFAAPVPMLNQPNPMLVKLQNYSDSEAEEVNLSLKYQGQTRPLGTKRISPNATIIDTINLSILSTGWQEAEFVISDYPITFDDNYKVAFEVNEKVKILSINESGQNKYLTAAYKGLNYFDIENQVASRINYADFKSQDLIIFNELSNLSSGLISSVSDYVVNGGNLLIFPAKNISKDSYNQLLSSLSANTIINSESGAKQVGYINTDEFIFNNVYLSRQRNIKYPTSTFNYVMTNFQNRFGEDLLRYRDGSTFLTKYRLGDGNTYVCASPLNESTNDLVRNAEVFVPMLYKMGLSKAKKSKIGLTIGKDKIIETDNIIAEKDIVYKITGKEEFIPAQFNIGTKINLDVRDQVKQEGFYSVVLDDKTLSRHAFNFDRLESDLRYFSETELEDAYGVHANIITQTEAGNLKEYIAVAESGTSLWRWLISAVLLFLGIESLLLRFWKT